MKVESEHPHGFDLGPLEAEVMRLVWEMGEVGVDEVHRTLQAGRPIAYTTVMTVMSRLAGRGLLERRKEGRAYLYRAAVARESLAGSTLKEWVQRYWGGKLMPAVSLLLASEKLTPEEVETLRKLVDQLSGKEGDR